MKCSFLLAKYFQMLYNTDIYLTGKEKSFMNYTYQLANQLGLYFKTNGKRCIIVKYRGNEKKVAIPDTIDKKPVRAIANFAFQNTDIQAVYIPNTVTKIGDGAFRNSSLEFVELPAHIEYVGAGAFKDCKNLENVKSLKRDLRMVTFGNNLFAGTAYIKKKGLVTLNNIFIKYNSTYRTAYIPYDTKVINENAFYDSNVEKVIFPLHSQFIDIRKNAFAYCSNLKDISFYELKNSKPDSKYYTHLFIKHGAFFKSKVYYDTLKKGTISQNENNIFFKTIKCEIHEKWSQSSSEKHDIYVPFQMIDYCFDINFDTNGNAKLYLNMSLYDELFENCTEHERIFYSYTRASASFDRNKIKESIEYLQRNKKSAIRNLMQLKDLNVIKNLVKWEVISGKYFDYAISKADKYGFKSCVIYLKYFKK